MKKRLTAESIFWYETLTLEMPGLYNFTTEELFIKPKLSYHIADALTITAGGEFYSGSEESLFDMIESHLSALFIELKASF